MRGYQKRVIYMKNPGSAVFEEAYFVIKENGRSEGDSPDIMDEANRIIEENTEYRAKRKEKFKIMDKLPAFLTGFMIGALIFSAFFIF